MLFRAPQSAMRKSEHEQALGFSCRNPQSAFLIGPTEDFFFRKSTFDKAFSATISEAVYFLCSTPRGLFEYRLHN